MKRKKICSAIYFAWSAKTKKNNSKYLIPHLQNAVLFNDPKEQGHARTHTQGMNTAKIWQKRVYSYYSHYGYDVIVLAHQFTLWQWQYKEIHIYSFEFSLRDRGKMYFFSPKKKFRCINNQSDSIVFVAVLTWHEYLKPNCRK